MILALREKLLSTSVFEECEYFDKYVQLISDNITTEAESGKTQCHHIIPRCYFEHRRLVVDDAPENLVNLLYRDHILAHYYLALCSIGRFKYSMELAFMMLVNFDLVEDSFISNLDRYQAIYESSIQSRRGRAPGNKGKPMSEEQKSKISESLKGHAVSDESKERMRQAQLNMSADSRARITAGTRSRNYRASEETRKKQSDSLKGHHVSAETRKKIGEKNKLNVGGKWYTDGFTSVFVRKDEQPPEGFRQGTLRKRFWCTNGENNISVSSIEDIPQGFVRGRTMKGRENKDESSKDN